MSSLINKGRAFYSSAQGVAVGFFLIIAVMALLAVVSLWRFSEVKSEFETVVDVHNVRIEYVQKMRILARERSPLLYGIIHTEDPFDTDEQIMELLHQGGEFLKIREDLIATGLEDNELKKLEEHREFARTIVAMQHQVIDWVREGRREEAIDLMVMEASPAQIEALKTLDQLTDMEEQKSKVLIAGARAAFDKTMRDVGATAILGSLFCLIVGMVVSFKFSDFIRALEGANAELESKVAERTKELESANERLKEIANYDSLTSLPNRSLFLEHLDSSMKRAIRHQNCIGLLFIDLDGFKGINDDHGHGHGDELLLQVAERMQASAREVDIVARLGGDEFTVILDHMEITDAAEEVAQRIVTAIAEPFTVFDTLCRISCSIGIALYPLHADTLDELIKCADEAMYDAKGSGKNGYRISHNLKGGCGHPSDGPSTNSRC